MFSRLKRLNIMKLQRFCIFQPLPCLAVPNKQYQEWICLYLMTHLVNSKDSYTGDRDVNDGDSTASSKILTDRLNQNALKEKIFPLIQNTLHFFRNLRFCLKSQKLSVRFILSCNKNHTFRIINRLEGWISTYLIQCVSFQRILGAV